MQPRSILKWIILLCLIGLIIGIYLISTTSDAESMTANYAPAHFLNTFNRPYESQSYAHVEGFVTGEEEPVPVAAHTSTQLSGIKDNINHIEVKIYNSPSDRSCISDQPVSSEKSGPYGHMPNYEVIVNDKPASSNSKSTVATGSKDGYNMIFPPRIPDQPYNPVEVDPAKCPVCPMNENQPWAEYRSLEDDVPSPY